MDIAGIRKEYTKKVLTEDSVDKDALVQFNNWFSEALHSDVPEPNAMTLATATKDGIPAARIVLLKGVDAGFVFFTNYKSHKGNNLEVNPNAALVFFWQELERQVRITGKVEKISTQESDDYYNSRPYESRLGAWASPQSNEITKAELEANFNQIKQRFTEEEIHRPAHWGGYRLIADSIEFWQGRPSRMHDRMQYKKEGSLWLISRLAP